MYHTLFKVNLIYYLICTDCNATQHNEPTTMIVELITNFVNIIHQVVSVKQKVKSEEVMPRTQM